jgi:hypothetical protein
MGNHWPILMALLMIGAAVGYGIVRQDDQVAATKAPTEYKDLPHKYDPYASLPGTPKATVPATNNAPVQPPAVNPHPALTPVVPQTQLVPQPPMRTGAQPTTVINPMPGQVDRDALFGMLRGALQQRFGVAPMATNTGYAVVVEGARIDVDASPNWSIQIFNNTKAQPPVQTENFLAIQNLVATTLDFNLDIATARQTADGKTVKRPISRLGKINVETDPAMFNSTTITPFGRTNFATQAAPANPVTPNNKRTMATQPVAPLAPAAPQVQPPQPPVRPMVKQARPVDPTVKTPLPQKPKTPTTPGAPTTDQF